MISAIGASFFLQDALRFFESLWRNTFYLTYPTLDVLDKTVPLGLNVVVPVKSLLVIVTALVSLGSAPSLCQSDAHWGRRFAPWPKIPIPRR